MAGADALIAKHATDLEDPLEAADDQTLQPQFGRDAQEEVAVEGVVVGLEGTSVRTRRDRIEYRGLDLDEPLRPTAFAHRARDLAATLQRGTCRRIGPEIGFAVSVAKVVVRDAGPLVAEVVLGRGEGLPRVDLHREFATLGSNDLAAHPDPVAQVQFRELLELVGHAREREQLDLTARVTHRGEGEFALATKEHQPAGDVHAVARLLAVGEMVVGRLQRRGVGVVRERIWQCH